MAIRIQPCHEKDCTNPQPTLPPYRPQPAPAPEPVPSAGFCDGTFEGYLFNEPGPLTLQIQQTGAYGEINVVGYWGGATWAGEGLCRQTAPSHAEIEFQFPNTPMQRGVINMDPDGAANLDGRVDGGDAFHLVRRAW